MSQTQDDQFVYAQTKAYAPTRLRRMLPHLRYFLVPGSRLDPDALLKQSPSSEWLEERWLQGADMLRALAQLDWFTYRCVVLAYVYIRKDEAIAVELECDRQTVSRRRNDGLRQMARFLGYEEDEEEHRKASPTVWRHPSLEAAS